MRFSIYAALLPITLGALVACNALEPRTHEAECPCPAQGVARVEPQSISVPTGYVLKFGDDFTGSSVNTTLWNYRTDVKGYSAQRPENVTVAGGTMRINLKAERYGGKSFTGGGLITKQRFDHGYFEIRARTTASPGWHTSFWAMNGDGSTTGGSARVIEVDGFETDSVARVNFDYGIWQWTVTPGKHSTCGSYNTPFDPATDFHVYGFEWTDTVTRYFVDGKLVCTQTYPATQYEHAPANLWLTSIGYKDPGPSASTLPADIQFDYMRYYERDPNYSAGSTIIVDNDEPGYTPSSAWPTSALTGYADSYTRFSNNPTASVSWIPTIKTAGQYTVSYYNVQGTAANLSSSASFTVTHALSSSTVIKDLQSAAAGWVELGVFTLSAGSGNAVKLVASSGKSLRADAVRFEPVTTPPQVSITLDNGETGYTENGDWLLSALPGQGGSTTRYAGSTGATATWTPTLATGRYVVSLYRVVNPGSDTNARVDVRANSTVNTQYLDLSSGSSGWVMLGTFDFFGSGSEYVSIQRGNGWVRADAVRFERQ